MDPEGRSAAFLEVADEVPALFRLKSGSNCARFPLEPGESREHRFIVEMHVKGRYSFDAVQVRVEDAWGLVHRTRASSLPAPVSVLPAAQRLRKVPARTKFPLVFLGAHLVRAPGQGTEFFGLREYLPSDPLKEVNWKASARSTGLVVNQREKETLADVTILLDARAVMGYGRADDNASLWAARATATLVHFFLQRRDRVRLVAYGETISVLDPDGGQSHHQRILNFLTDLSPAGSLPFVEATRKLIPRLHRKSPVVVVSSLVDDATVVEGVSLLQALSMHTVVLSIEPRNHVPDGETQALVDLERRLAMMDLRGVGARVIAWQGDQNLMERLMEVAP